MLQKIDRRDLSGTYAKRLNRYCLFKIRDARLLFKSEAESSDRFGVSLLNRFGMSLLIWTWRGIYVRAVFPLPHQGEGKKPTRRLTQPCSPKSRRTPIVLREGISTQLFLQHFERVACVALGQILDLMAARRARRNHERFRRFHQCR